MEVLYVTHRPELVEKRPDNTKTNSETAQERTTDQNVGTRH